MHCPIHNQIGPAVFLPPRAAAGKARNTRYTAGRDGQLACSLLQKMKGPMLWCTSQQTYWGGREQ